MRYLKSAGCVPLRKGLLVHFSFSLTYPFIAIPLIFALDILGNPNDEDPLQRQVVLTLRALITTYLSICLLTFSTLIYGIVKRKTRLFFPYFVVASVIIPVGIGYGIYVLTLTLPGKVTYALIGICYGAVEVLFLYATVSYYKQVKQEKKEERSNLTPVGV